MEALSDTRIIFENLADGIFVHEPEGFFIHVNATACKMLGYSRDELLKLLPTEVDDPAFSHLFPERVERLMQRGQARFETILLSKDGRRIPVELNSRCIPYRGGTAILTIARDISERHQIETMLVYQMQLQRTLIDMSAAFATLGPADNIKDAIEECLANLGSMVGASYCYLIFSISSNELPDGMNQIRCWKNTDSRSEFLSRKEMTTRGELLDKPFDLSSEIYVALDPDRDDPGNEQCILREARFPLSGDRTHSLGALVVGFALPGRQLPEEARTLMGVASRTLALVVMKVQAEERLRLVQKMDAIGQLAAGIAHEINTPIHFVTMNISFLGEVLNGMARVIQEQRKLIDAAGTPLSDLTQLKAVEREIDYEYLMSEYPSVLEQTQSGVARVADIVMAMRDFSHPGRGKRGMLNFNACVREATDISRNEWKYVAVLELDLEPDMPELECYPAEIQQVVLNLIVNASHAVSEAVAKGLREYGRIWVQTRAADQRVSVIVRDDGIGIPKHIQSRVTEPFFTTKDVGKGTGQGLAIAYDVVVNKHGGTLTFSSEVDEGSEFVITIPIQSTLRSEGVV